MAKGVLHSNSGLDQRVRPQAYGGCVLACSHENCTMAYSESLAQRIRQAVAGHRAITEKKMFGGVGFLLHGNMCVGIWQSSLIVRLGPEQGAAALEEPNVAPFDITGRPMKGWVMIEPDGIETDEQLAGWVRRSIDFVSTLPKK
jgi:TfoX/Sxy family transcriptional regulator of competence genes